jgi:2-alkyl-3-oxoalkanoate reductase
MPELNSLSDATHGSSIAHGSVRQRILVLGASGFIGQNVVERLSSSDWALPVAAGHRRRVHPRAALEVMEFDARQPAAMNAALRGVAGVVNCITGDVQTIVKSASALFDAASQMTSPPRIVHLSTMMVYGSTVGEVDETALLNGDWDDYSAAKAEVEKIARTCKSVVHLRPGIVYGPQSPIWSVRIGRWLLQRRLGDLGPVGAGRCNLVHVDDVVTAIDRALRVPGIEGEAFNLSLPAPPTWNDYFRLFAAALGAPFVAISPTRLMLEQYVLAPPLKIAELLLSKAPFKWHAPAPIRPWLLRLCCHDIRMAVGKAERVLGMKWTPLDKGLSESAAWLLAEDGGNIS